jgi:UDP-N-acetylglucosamine 1-carboxyvinyltransferase
MNPYHLTAMIAKLEEAGCETDVTADSITLTAPEQLQAVNITTAVYPGFPTDLQAQWAASMLSAEGTSRITDTVYPTRFQYAAEMSRMGADIEVGDGNIAIKGGKKLTGSVVMSTDLRASASLILAALVAEGRSEILRIYHIDRGYEAIEEKLTALGANIKREQTEDF